MVIKKQHEEIERLGAELAGLGGSELRADEGLLPNYPVDYLIRQKRKPMLGPDSGLEFADGGLLPNYPVDYLIRQKQKPM